jgi:hypothetical protein
MLHIDVFPRRIDRNQKIGAIWDFWPQLPAALRQYWKARTFPALDQSRATVIFVVVWPGEDDVRATSGQLVCSLEYFFIQSMSFFTPKLAIQLHYGPNDSI